MGLACQAHAHFKEHARPEGVLMELSHDDFSRVYHGEGLNDVQSPIGPIYRASDSLALYAVSVGGRISGEIARLFQADEFATGATLDSAASAGAELAARQMGEIYRRYLSEMHRLDATKGVLRFSPGYCGWHISAQRALFGMLNPEEIGITLNASCLMQPLKSVSGVLIAGNKEIFEFDDVFDFCRDCTDHACRDRIKSLMAQ
jgi:hypothetical protein